MAKWQRLLMIEKTTLETGPAQPSLLAHLYIGPGR